MQLGKTQIFASPGEALDHAGKHERSVALRDFHEKPGAPGDVLAHYGVKGMRWGVRKEEETSDRAPAAKQDAAGRQRALVELGVGTPIGIGFDNTSTEAEKSGLSNKQKALIGLGVLGAAAGGYYAYTRFKNKTFLPGGKHPPEWDVSGLKRGPISDVDLVNGGFSAKYPTQRLSDADFLNVDHSKGYANYSWKNTPEVGGLAQNAFAQARHKDLTDTLDEMRERYPSVRNLKLEVVPMSSVPGMEAMRIQGAVAAVMPLGKGEARVMYNDMIDSFAPPGASRDAVEAFVPGMFRDKYVGYHEMGHILAVANGDMPALGKLMEGNSLANVESAGDFKNYLKNNIKYGAARNFYHRQTFKKHGFTFEELSQLGGYAATQPMEAMAELAGHYHHPEMRRRLTPDQQARAKKMFDEMGGRT